MMKNLHLVDGMQVSLRRVELPKLRYMKIQPYSSQFLKIKDITGGMDPKVSAVCACLPVCGGVDVLALADVSRGSTRELLDARPW